MKKIKVKVICEMQIPDDWQLQAPHEEEQEHLMVDGKFYAPEMVWMEYKGDGEEGIESWQSVDDETFELLEERRTTMEYSITKAR